MSLDLNFDTRRVWRRHLWVRCRSEEPRLVLQPKMGRTPEPPQSPHPEPTEGMLASWGRYKGLDETTAAPVGSPF